MAKPFDLSDFERSCSRRPLPGGKSPACIDDDRFAADPATGEGVGAFELFEEWDQEPEACVKVDPAVEMLEMGLSQAD
jgi:hypothetical protein